jgi:hypothetical protein
MSTISNITDGFRIAMDLATAANRVEDVAKLIETQQLVMQVLEDNRQLTDQVAELKDELAMDSQLERDQFSYSIHEDDGTKTGPVCPVCYKRHRVVVQLIPVKGNIDPHFCPHCKEQTWVYPPRVRRV